MRRARRLRDQNYCCCGRKLIDRPVAWGEGCLISVWKVVLSPASSFGLAALKVQLCSSWSLASRSEPRIGGAQRRRPVEAGPLAPLPRAGGPPATGGGGVAGAVRRPAPPGRGGAADARGGGPE